MSQKRIPTIFGLVILVVALVIGVLFIGDGPGVFAPRATPETTPKNIKVTNLTDNSFTVSFLTDGKTAGFVKYGKEPNKLNTQAVDDRDQLSGNVGEYQLHHITIRGLDPNTPYYYVLGTGGGATFDNNGAPFTVKTAARSGAPAAAKTVYGSVTNASGGPADGAIAYLLSDKAGEMSSLVKNSGSWAIPLSNARTPDGSGFAVISDEDSFRLLIQGTTANLQTTANIKVSDAQPVATINLGGQNTFADQQETKPAGAEPPSTEETEPIDDAEDILMPGDDGDFSITSQGDSGALSSLVDDTDPDATKSATVDFDVTEEQEVETTQPTIVGKLPPNTPVRIVINSETQIEAEFVTDADGFFELSLAQLEQELEPGVHTATVYYTDPNTGQETSVTRTFTVSETATAADTSTQIAQADTSTENQPFGTSNPVPLQTATPTPTPTPDNTASESATPSAAPATRSAMPATDSAVPVSGSVGTTMALVFGGLFFIISGAWSFWISYHLDKRKSL